MYFIKLLIQLSIFLLCINVSFQQNEQIGSVAKKMLMKENPTITEDPYDAEDKTNPTNLDFILNIDPGRYTTMLFDYHNQQNTYATVNYAKESNDSCINSYLACLISGTTLTPVCVTNDIAYTESTITFMSYCDMYFDNCRRGYRVWRIIAYGFCFWNTSGEKKIYQFDSETFVSDAEIKKKMEG